jgi:putative transposase
VLLRLAYLTVSNTFAVLRLLPASDRDKDIEILVLRHQIAVLERQLGGQKVRFAPPDRAFLAAVLHRLAPDVLRCLRLLVRPDTVLRWHRDLIACRHAARSKPKRPGRPPTVRSIRVLVLRLVWGSRISVRCLTCRFLSRIMLWLGSVDAHGVVAVVQPDAQHPRCAAAPGAW